MAPQRPHGWAVVAVFAAAALAPWSACTAVGHAQEPEAQPSSDDPQRSSLEGTDDAPPPPPGPEAQIADLKARSLFEQGREAYDDGRFRDAWDYFHQAYTLSERPELLYNVGQAADRMRRDREAVAAFRLYLKRVPDAENRREVENRLKALEARVRADDAERTLATGEQDGEEGDQQDLGFFSDDESEDAIVPPGAQPQRSGWYVRGAIGLGVLRDELSNATDLALTGGTVAGQLSVGYGILDELVIGGSLFFDLMLAPSVEGRDIDSANLAMIGPFVDFFLDPHGDGWHLLGAVTVGALNVSDDSATLPQEAVGGGALMLGGGYEWPIEREWAIGVLGRLVLARLSQDFADHTVVSPSIAFTGVFY